VVLVWLGASPCQAAPAPIDRVAKVQGLSPAKLRQGRPVEIHGTVTLCDESSQLMVIQDGTGAIGVMARAFAGAAPGDRVIVKAFTAYEAFAPMLVKPTIQRISTGSLPGAARVTLEQVFNGKLDYQRVELECKVLEAHSFGLGRFDLVGEGAGKTFSIQGNFVLPRTLFFNVAGRKVRLRGIPVMARQPSGDCFSLTFFVADAQDIQEIDALPAAVGEGPDASLPLLTSVNRVKALTNEEARRGYPVRLRGVVTCFDPTYDQLWIQDETSGIFIRPPQYSPKGLETGAVVEVEGKTAEGCFALWILPTSLRVLGKAPLPKPIQIHPELGFPAWEENRWAEVEGIITLIRYNPANGQLEMGLRSGSARFTLRLAGPPSLEADFAHLIDCNVKVRGVYISLFSTDMRLTGFGLKLPYASCLEVVPGETGDSLESPPRRIHGLLEYNPGGIPRHRVKVAGQVTFIGWDGTIYVQDASGSIRVDGYSILPSTSSVGTDRPRIGDTVEALGFFDWARAKVSLSNAVLRVKSSDTAAPEPLAVAAEGLNSGIHDGRLVRIEGFLREQTQSFGDRILFLESGRTVFKAVLEQPQDFPGLDRLRSGALVRLTGICDMIWDETQSPATPSEIRIRLRDPEDILVLKDGPFWTLSRSMALMSVLLVVLLGATLTLVLLQRRLKARSVQLQTEMDGRVTLEDQLRQSQKLEGVGRLAGGVAHDFNNLLTVINGYCEMLVSELEGQKDLQGCAQEIRKAGERAASLTKQLLAFSRKQILQPVVLDLNELVQDMEKMLSRLIVEDIKLSQRVSSEPCYIKVDPGQISQVLMNLVVNARDAMPHGGEIILEIDPVFLDAETLQLRPDVTPGSYVRLTVSDTGLGMDAQTQEKIFEPFFTTKEQGKGTGLGLSTVFGVVKQSGGHIWVYSEVGHGTAFKLFFPRIEEAPVEPEIPDERTNPGGETILVVEDQPEVRQFIQRALESHGYRILTAGDAEEAQALSRRFSSSIHLLLTDMVMPGINGRELAKRLLVSRSAMRVLFMSGYTEDVVVHKGILESGIEFIQKPFSAREIADRVAEILNRR